MDIFESSVQLYDKKRLKGIVVWGRALSWTIISGLALLIVVFLAARSLEANQRDSFEEFYVFFAILIPFLIPAILLYLATGRLKQGAGNDDEVAMSAGLRLLRHCFLATTIVVMVMLILTIGVFFGTYIVETL